MIIQKTFTFYNKPILGCILRGIGESSDGTYRCEYHLQRDNEVG
jgi:hypothetical protein